MSQDHINYILKIIEKYRQIIKRPYDIKNVQYGTCYDLREPLQVSLLWLGSKINDLQIFLISHNERIPDSSIEIFGPFDFEKDETFNEIESLFEQGALFKNLVPDISHDELRFNLERRIREKARTCLNQESTNKPIEAGAFGRNNYLVSYNGNLFNCDIEEIISFFHKEKEKLQKHIIATSGSFQDYMEKQDRSHDFLGGFILPPVWFGNPPELTQKHKLRGVGLNHFITRIYDNQISERKIIIESDGYLGIYIDKRKPNLPVEELQSIIKDLNFIFGVFLLEGVFIKSVQTSEFTRTTYMPDTDNLSFSYPSDSESERLFNKRFEAVNLGTFPKERTIVPLSNLSHIMTLAKRLIEDKEMYESLSLLVHSRSNLAKDEVNQAFILNWTIIEQNLNYMWKLLIESRQITGNRRKNLIKSRDYTASVISEVLNLTGVLSNEDLKILSTLRKARNDFMHDMVPIPRQLAIQSFKLARSLIKNRLTDFANGSWIGFT